MTVAIQLLGGFCVTVDGEPVAPSAWHRRSASALVKLLALQPDRGLRREQVVDALWPELLLDEAAPRLHQAAHYARRALRNSDGVVLAGDRVTLLPAEQVVVDVADFETAADAAEGDPARAATATDRYTGDLLPDDLFEPWAEGIRDRLRLRHRELLWAAGRWAALVAADPLDEEAHVALAREHLEYGRRSALRQLDHLAVVLRRELGVDPGDAAATLRAQVLAIPVDERRRSADLDLQPLYATTHPSDQAVQRRVAFGRGEVLLRARRLDQLVAVGRTRPVEPLENPSRRRAAAELPGDAEGNRVGDGQACWRVHQGGSPLEDVGDRGRDVAVGGRGRGSAVDDQGGSWVPLR